MWGLALALAVWLSPRVAAENPGAIAEAQVPENLGYVGSEECADCHEDQYDDYRASVHFQTESGDWPATGCESCHGPGLAHVEDPENVRVLFDSLNTLATATDQAGQCSGSVDLQLPNLSFHYWLDLDEVRKNLKSFGFRTPTYRKVKWPELPKYESIGRWESDFYEPHLWRNDYPNPAFVRMTDRDAFWAAKIIVRQRKTARRYMNRVNPIDQFEVTGNTLTFRNLSEDYGFAEPGSVYRVQWSIYDNASGTHTALGPEREITSTMLAVPDAEAVAEGRDKFFVAEIHAIHDDHPMWNRRVLVYLRPVGDRFEVVGIDRESDPPDHLM